VHHRLQSGANRLKSSHSQQVQGGGSHRGHHAGPIAPVAESILMELGVMDPVPPSARRDASPIRPFQPPGGLMESFNASLQQDRQAEGFCNAVG